jgi:hypothetical protein
MTLRARVFCLILPLLAGMPLRTPAQSPADSTNAWGYDYDSLLVNLAQWRQNPLAKVDSIGASVQNRALWRITVGDTTANSPRVFVHARTHPAEVQAFYVIREMLNFLLDTTAEAATLRATHIFHFVPMYNPDGVELGYARQNANRIDIESNWNNVSPQPEVVALRAHFQALMASPRKVRVALNLHSDQFNCSRFFFFHEASGTSPTFAELEENYITGVRSYFLEGIQPWNYITSWSTFQSQYPESFWWLAHGPAVMALTYEDTNCPGAGDFYRTGRAIVLGSRDYIRDNPVVALAHRAPRAREVVPGAGRNGPVFLHRNNGRIEYRDAQGRLLKIQP